MKPPNDKDKKHIQEKAAGEGETSDRTLFSPAKKSGGEEANESFDREALVAEKNAAEYKKRFAGKKSGYKNARTAVISSNDVIEKKCIQESVVKKDKPEDRTILSPVKHSKINDEQAAVKPKASIKKFIANKKTTDDKTRIASKRETPQVSDKTRIASKRETPQVNDKTRIATTKKTPQNNDKTRFSKPMSSGGDKTRAYSGGQGARPAPNNTAPANPNIDGDHYGILKNRFILESVLGSGGMGVVYKAKDLLKIEAQDRDPYVAIKVLSDEFKSHPEAFIALQRESRKTQNIAHPNIVNVHDFDKDGDTVFMTMEFLDGKPLDELIRQYKSTGLPQEDVEAILAGISAALMHANQQHVIHSDFKPGNIFVTKKGLAKVFDFGIARAVGKADKFEERQDDKTIFDAGNLGALTPAYASAEMLEGEEPDVRDDIYALGCIAYELCTGVHPFNRVHANEAQRQKLKPKRIADISKKQWLAIEKALEFKREDRVATVAEFWAMYTKKYTPGFKVYAVFAVLMVAILAGAFQYIQSNTNTLSEDDFRDELEDKVRLEFHKKEIARLLGNPSFLERWEEQIWGEIQGVREMLESKDEWLVLTEVSIFSLYLEKITGYIKEGRLSHAKLLIANAQRYSADADLINQQETLLAEALKAQEKLQIEKQGKLDEQKRQQELALKRKRSKALVAKENVVERSKFDAAFNNVKKELSCQNGLNMRDLGIAVDKLRSLSMTKYTKAEPSIVKSLSACIVQIGLAFPDRAHEYRKQALRMFDANSTIAGVKIVSRDPCDPSLAGLGARGARGLCKDKIPNVGSGPSMVVVPAKGNIKSFAIGKYEVSIAEINKFCIESGFCEKTQGINNTFPATNITIGVAKEYLKWLSDKTDKKYRLPTKSEWSYAAKAKSKKLNPNRNCRLDTRGIQKGGILVKASVGAKNEWGLVNHIGNASEWVLDKGGKLVAQGGSYATEMQECNFTSLVQHSGQKDKTTGFRVLREIN
jgi:hypothetical protein